MQKNNSFKSEKQVRFFEIDVFRGAAVLMMVVFHFFWDTNYFGFTNIALYEGFFGIFQKITAGTFLLLVGIGLSISFNRNQQEFEKRFFLRATKTFFLALLITAFSLVFVPTAPIFFGVLHLIAVSILLSVFFVKKNYLNLVLGLLIIFVGIFAKLQFGPSYLSWIGLAKSLPALDFFPVIPWFGVVLIGLFAGKKFAESGFKMPFFMPKNKATEIIGVLGQKSLFIYFIHQPILFFILWITKLFL